jgi:hypothetical protein
MASTASLAAREARRGNSMKMRWIAGVGCAVGVIGGIVVACGGASGGASDGGADAAFSEGGPVDGSRADRTTSETGTPEGGTADAASPDGATADSAPPETGPQDASCVGLGSATEPCLQQTEASVLDEDGGSHTGTLLVLITQASGALGASIEGANCLGTPYDCSALLDDAGMTFRPPPPPPSDGGAPTALGTCADAGPPSDAVGNWFVSVVRAYESAELPSGGLLPPGEAMICAQWWIEKQRPSWDPARRPLDPSIFAVFTQLQKIGGEHILDQDVVFLTNTIDQANVLCMTPKPVCGNVENAWWVPSGSAQTFLCEFGDRDAASFDASACQGISQPWDGGPNNVNAQFLLEVPGKPLEPALDFFIGDPTGCGGHCAMPPQ